MHFTHFSNALHTFPISSHKSSFALAHSFLALYHTYIHTTRTYISHHFYTRICQTLHFFLKQCGIFLGIAFSSSIALHFFFKGCVGYFYFLSSVCGAWFALYLFSLDLVVFFFPFWSSCYLLCCCGRSIVWLVIWKKMRVRLIFRHVWKRQLVTILFWDSDLGKVGGR